MGDQLKDIRNLDDAALENVMHSLGEKPYRSRQIREWIWKKSATSFEEMSTLPVVLRSKLKQTYQFRPLETDVLQESSDGTLKFRFRLHDGHLVESVLIPSMHRLTVCVSSQVGCSLNCSFCATGKMGLKRNLEAAEIYDQIVMVGRTAEEKHGRPLTNIVFMGMGEPLLNYKNLMASIDRITSPNGLGISPRRITVSTAGIAKLIRRLADDKVRFNLALSLHAPDDFKRSKIMPINESNNLDSLLEALNYFYAATHSRMTFEYILFSDFNDTEEDAKKLIQLCRKIPVKVNLIEYNPIEGVSFNKTKESRRERFVALLEHARVNAQVRRSRGKDIAAACGQLANKKASGKDS